MLAPTSDPTSMSTLKAKKKLGASRLAFSWLSGVEVRSEKRSKNGLQDEMHLGIDFSAMCVDV